jgi:hypothetical protein
MAGNDVCNKVKAAPIARRGLAPKHVGISECALLREHNFHTPVLLPAFRVVASIGFGIGRSGTVLSEPLNVETRVHSALLNKPFLNRPGTTLRQGEIVSVLTFGIGVSLDAYRALGALANKLCGLPQSRFCCWSELILVKIKKNVGRELDASFSCRLLHLQRLDLTRNILSLGGKGFDFQDEGLDLEHKVKRPP